MLADALDRVVGVHVADDDERRVVGDVVAAVVAVEVVARHPLQVAQPADGRMAVGMGLEGRRVDLDVQQLVRVVLAALQLGDDDRPLGLALLRLVQPVGHALGLDEQHPVERVARGRLEVGRLVDPGVPVPAPAKFLDDALDLLARDVGRPLEVHVLDPVRHAGLAGRLVAGPDLVPAPDRRERGGVDFLDEDLQTVVEKRGAQGGCVAHPVIIDGRGTVRHACM